MSLKYVVPFYLLSNVVFSNNCDPPTCTTNGEYLADSCICAKYYICDASLNAIEYNCAAGTLWDVNTNICNWDYLVECMDYTQCGIIAGVLSFLFEKFRWILYRK